jgi:AcrR family transcriptional regulator
MARYSEEDSRKIRERIINNASKMILEEGTSTFNMRELANRAQVSPTTLYNVFETKSKLFIDVLLCDIAQDAEELNIQISVEHCFHDIMAHMDLIESQLQNKQQFVLALLNGILTSSGKINTKVLNDLISELLCLWLQDKVAKHVLTDELDTPVVAQQLSTVFVGNLFQWMSNSLPFDRLKNHIKLGFLSTIEKYTLPPHASDIQSKIDDVLRLLSKHP